MSKTTLTQVLIDRHDFKIYVDILTNKYFFITDGTIQNWAPTYEYFDFN